MNLLSVFICEVRELQLYLKTKVMFNFCLPVVPTFMFPLNLLLSILSTFLLNSIIVPLMLVTFTDNNNGGREYKV